MSSGFACRVCGGDSSLFFKGEREFYKCSVCLLIFTNEQAIAKKVEEHYRKQWETASPGFWKSQVDVLMQAITQFFPEPIGRTLDFGSGSGEITKELIARKVDAFPFEPMVHGSFKEQDFKGKFNVILGVEVIEHLPNLWEELRNLESVLAPGGIMLFTTGLTNQFVLAPNAKEIFEGWWYKDDPTHVSFFCNESIAHIGDRLGFSAHVFGEQIFVLKREK